MSQPHLAVCVRLLLLAVTAVLAVPAVALADGADDVQKALDKLDAAHSYTWATQSTGGGHEPDATGKVDHVSGYASVATTVGGKPLAIIAKDFRQVINTDAGWKDPADLLGNDAAQPVLAAAMHYQALAEVIRWHVEDVTAFAASPDGTLVGDLPAKAARGEFGSIAKGKPIAAAKGTVAVTLAKDGTVSKIVTHLTATGDGGDTLADRTITTTITDADHTTPDVPAEAKAALAK